MAELRKDVAAAQLNLGVSVTLVKTMCGNSAGMGQLIKYFESQSRRLDQQTFHASLPAFNPDFESAIKFNRVPILSPAITPSRRDEIRQYKKDAVLLEKRLKVRQRRQFLVKAGSLGSGTQVTFPDSGARPAARQLNFDQQEETIRLQNAEDRLGATNPQSTFATVELDMTGEEFGLQTMDSVNSDFMSLEEGAIPKVFNGLVLTSFKEQKISYDLDRLSKALNVQELTSTSGSDMSDALGSTQTCSEEDLQSAHKLAEKLLTGRAGDDNEIPSASFFHESQDTVVEVSPEAEAAIDSTSTSGFVENTSSTNLEQFQNSIGSSPSCGSANTTATSDSQRSNRSSPKSLKNAVHFSSFVTEYINTSSSQYFDRPTIVKKKMPYEMVHGKEVVGDSVMVLPIIGDPNDARHRSILSHKVSDGLSANSLLDKVSFTLEGDSSPVTSPIDLASGIPFQNYCRSDQYNSDKENDASRSHKSPPQEHRKHSENGARLKHLSGENSGTNPNGYKESKAAAGKKRQSSPATESRNLKGVAVTKDNTSSLQQGNHQNMPSSMVSTGIGPQDLPSVSTSVSVGSSTCDSTTLVSASQVCESVTSGKISAGRISVSQESLNKSTTLTGSSGSDNSTVRKDAFAKESVSLALNIVDFGNGSACLDAKSGQKPITEAPQHGLSSNNPTHSPKKLNTNASRTNTDLEDSPETPPRTFVRRGSYTLSEPSPALIQARSRLEAQQKEKDLKEERTPEFNEISSAVVQQANGKQVSRQQQELPFRGAMTPMNISVPLYAEKEGKAEHINKYLNQVQLQNSMNFSTQSWDVVHSSAENREENEVTDTEGYPELGENGEEDDPHQSVMDVLRSIAESQGSLEHLSVEELLSLHEQQMEEKRHALISQQQREMEELFVQQRREVMLLETEIKAAQQQEREQQEFLIQNAPENIKVKARNHEWEYSPEHSSNLQQQNSLGNLQPQLSQCMASGDQSLTPSLKLQPKSYPGMNVRENKLAQGARKSHSAKKSNVKYSSPERRSENHQTQVKAVADNSFSPKATPPLDLIALTNKNPDFSPSVSSPRVYHTTVLRSPLKYTSLQRRNSRVIVPPEAFHPENKAKFDKVSAVAKGFLTRCLLRSAKVQELVKTIKDTREFAFNFQTETPMKKGIFTPQDRALLERIIAQLQAALLDIHEIFFEIPCSERMALIQQTRMLEYEKRVKASNDSMKGSGPRISLATLKALERKRRAREAETLAVQSISRPMTAPPSTSSQRSISQTDIRALKPLQGQSHSQVGPTLRPDSSRSEKSRPQTAPDKQLTRPKRITAPSVKPATTSTSSESQKDAQKESVSKQTAIVLSKPVIKSKVAPSKTSSSRPTKSWR